MNRHEVIESLREHWLSENDLAWMEALDEGSLAALRDEVLAHGRRVDEAQASLYGVMAATTKFMPNFVVAKMAVSLDPYVVAQITRHLDTKTAAGIAKSLDPAFLGEVALHLDVKKCSEITNATDIDRVTQVVERMSDRGFHRRLGELADAMEPGTLNKLTNKLGDPERVAMIAAEMHNEGNLREVARAIKPKFLERIIRVLETRGTGQLALQLMQQA